jgi:hypothetical protein
VGFFPFIGEELVSYVNGFNNSNGLLFHNVISKGLVF